MRMQENVHERVVCATDKTPVSSAEPFESVSGHHA